MAESKHTVEAKLVVDMVSELMTNFLAGTLYCKLD